MMERLAEKLNLDPLDLRLKVLNTKGNLWTTPVQAYTVPGGNVAVLQAAATAFNWKARYHKPGANIKGTKAYGVGLGFNGCGHGAGGNGNGLLKMNTDGTIDLMTGTNEVGAGQHMEQRMICAETIGAKLSDVNMMFGNDSSVSTDTGASVGSSQTKRAGNGTKAAATIARAKLFELVTTSIGGKPPLIDAKPEDLDAANSVIFLKADPSKKATFAQAVALQAQQIVAAGYGILPANLLHQSFSCSMVEVEVDLETGAVECLEYCNASNLGKIINLTGAEGQLDASTVFNFGEAFTEEELVDPTYGFPLNASFVDYKPPVSTDLPIKNTRILVETPDVGGPYGAHGFAEPSMGAGAPATANAVSNAIGAWITSAPVTRAKILAALASKKA